MIIFRVLSEFAQCVTALFLLSFNDALASSSNSKFQTGVSKSGSVLKLNAEENNFEVILSVQLKLVLYLKKDWHRTWLFGLTESITTIRLL